MPGLMLLQFCQIQTALSQIRNSRVSSDQAPAAFTESQFQQALPGMEGRVVAVVVAVSAGPASFAWDGG